MGSISTVCNSEVTGEIRYDSRQQYSQIRLSVTSGMERDYVDYTLREFLDGMDITLNDCIEAFNEKK